MVVEVDPRTQDPDDLWRNVYSKERVCKPVDHPVNRGTLIRDDAVRFVCISDTHEKLESILPRIPEGDVLVHCGDFTNFGDYEEILKFNESMGKLPHKYKIVIAGNHELGFEDDEDESLRLPKYQNRGTPRGYELLTNCIYLQDNFAEVYGVKVYGSSWHPMAGYSFSRRRGRELLDKWNMIPKGVHVLLTHTPPLGHNDVYQGLHHGCAELVNTVEKRVKPKFHIFGHIHEKHGVTSNNETFFVNASICSHALDCINDAILFDVPLKPGITKIPKHSQIL
ncbi:hypothetical protein L596_027601 [Steinernema carpocapsae]|uniref:Calcineurin-like phosphoesterase domain-containing protein n=1 Tax=Steinernema carpocapsae TaxID=34508 RepID=A0A4U5LW10_STECR|nr:hypothetical protein L596_027601 [Steinernema carpocapsae]